MISCFGIVKEVISNNFAERPVIFYGKVQDDDWDEEVLSAQSGRTVIKIKSRDVVVVCSKNVRGADIRFKQDILVIFGYLPARFEIVN